MARLKSSGGDAKAVAATTAAAAIIAEAAATMKLDASASQEEILEQKQARWGYCSRWQGAVAELLHV